MYASIHLDNTLGPLMVEVVLEADILLRATSQAKDTPKVVVEPRAIRLAAEAEHGSCSNG